MKIGRKVEEKQLTRQEQNKRNTIKRVGISAFVAFLMFIGLTVIQSSILNQEDKQQVYKVAKDIEVGTKITEENIDTLFTLSELQVSLIPEGYITKSEDMVGKFVNREYKVNDVITTDGITDTEKLYKDSIENPIEISFSVSSLGGGVAGIIREGDYINIYGLRKIENTNANAALAIAGYSGEVLYTVDDAFTFKHVYVTKALDGNGTEVKPGTQTEEEESNEDTATTLFNVIISEKDAEVFNEMLKNCDIRVSKLLYTTDKDYTEFLNEANKSAGEFSKETTEEKKTDNKKKQDKAEATPEATPEAKANSEATDEEAAKAAEKLQQQLAETTPEATPVADQAQTQEQEQVVIPSATATPSTTPQ